MLIFIVTRSRSSPKVRVIGQSWLSQEKNIAEVISVTRNEGFLDAVTSPWRRSVYVTVLCIRFVISVVAAHERVSAC